MNENEQIIELLKSINSHLKALDESMLAMKKRIDHIDDRIIQEDDNNAAMAIMQAESEEKPELPYDEQFDRICKMLVNINRNVVTGDNNGRVREENIRTCLNYLRDEEEAYFNERTKQMSQILSMLKSIHIWNG